jgi:hypothetical protein
MELHNPPGVSLQNNRMPMIRSRTWFFFLLLPGFLLANMPEGVGIEMANPEKIVLNLRFTSPRQDSINVNGEFRLRYTFPESNGTMDDSTHLTRILQIPLALHSAQLPDLNIRIIKSEPFSRAHYHDSRSFATFSNIRYFRSAPFVHLFVDPFFQERMYIREARVEISLPPAKGDSRPLSKEEKAFFRDAVINPDAVRIPVLLKPENQLKKTMDTMSGTWYQLGVKETGIYEITGMFLEEHGLTLSELNKNRISLFVSSTRGRPYTSNLPEKPHIREIPVLITGDNADFFSQQDKIIFFGESVSGWYTSSSTGPQYAQFRMNPYETINHYWLFISDSDEHNSKRMNLKDNTPAQGAVNMSWAWGRFHHEKEEANVIQGGTNWYGESFNGPASLRTVSLTLVNPAPQYSDDAFIRFGVAGASKSGFSTDRHTFEFTLNNELIWGIVTAFDYRETSKLTQIPSDMLQEENTLLIEYSSNGANTRGFLDYVDIIYPKALTANENYLRFWHPVPGQPLSFSVSEFSSSLIYVFDVSDPLNPRYFSENKASFTVNHSQSGLEADYIISSESHFKTPHFIKDTSIDPLLPESFNQADMVIVTHKDFLPAAGRLKNFRENHWENPLSVEIFTVEDVYAKYSGGNQDPHAIRNLLYDMTQRAPQPSPFYLVLLGDGDYDYRNISGKSKIFVPQYAISAGSIIHTRNTDDPFVYLSANSDDSPDMAVGRIPSNSLKEADIYIDKLIAYETRETPGDWQIRATLIADDPTNPWPNEPEFIKDSEYKILPTLPKAMKIHKIYLTEFPELYDPTIGSMGRVGAREAVLDAFVEGTVLMNYIGHGSPFVWAQEYIFTKDRDLKQVKTNNQYPFIVAATCDWGRSDYIGIQSMAEEMVNLEQNGAIGTIASTRGVLNLDNVDFTRKIYNALFPDPQNSARNRIMGNAYLQGKIQAWSTLNVSKFQYFGDPALTLAIPKLNGDIYIENGDTLKALSLVNASGSVFNDDEQLIKEGGLSGKIELYDSDRPVTREYRYFSGGTYRTGVLNYTLPGSRLFSGAVSIEDGLFNARFMIPKDIRYEGNNGMIRFRYTSDDYRTEGVTFLDSLILAGSSDTAGADFAGPEISLVTATGETFTSSSILISDTTHINIRLKDPSGINITGSTGHAIMIRTNETETDITALFTYDKDSWQEGSIHLTAGEWFSEGEQKVEISAFDNFNNFSNETFYVSMVSSHDDILSDVMNFPNPFKGSTHFTFHNMRSGDVQVKVFTLSGAMMAHIDAGYIERGFNSIYWDGLDSYGDYPAAGIYIYTLKLVHDTGTADSRGKLVILP